MFNRGKSHPNRDAWIEIADCWRRREYPSRIPYGMRGLKFLRSRKFVDAVRCIPYGMCGLKYDKRVRPDLHYRSYPIWDTCIEMVRF